MEVSWKLIIQKANPSDLDRVKIYLEAKDFPTPQDLASEIDLKYISSIVLGKHKATLGSLIHR